MKVVKNKLAPPFRTGHTSLIYGKGIPNEISVVDMAIDYGVIVKKGSWLAYKGETLAQGKEATAQYLTEHKELQEEVVRGIMAKVGEGIGFIPNTSDVLRTEDDDLALSSENLGLETETETDADDGILEISDSEADAE